METKYLVFKNSRQKTFVHKDYRCRKTSKLTSSASISTYPPQTQYIYRLPKGERNSHKKVVTNPLFMKKRRKEFVKHLLQFGLIVVLFVLISATVGFMQSDLAISDNTDLQLSKVTVGSGDTLWSIAKTFHDSKHDIREFIYYIKKLNQLDTAQIHPGQELYIPSLDY